MTGFALAVEIGDWHRFTGRSIGSFVGLVPCEHSSGTTRVQGSITKTGNTHARRLLVEAAWHHRPAYRPGKTIRDRWDLAPRAARQRGDLGNRRLHERWVKFNLRKKRPVTANVAIARELHHEPDLVAMNLSVGPAEVRLEGSLGTATGRSVFGYWPDSRSIGQSLHLGPHRQAARGLERSARPARVASKTSEGTAPQSGRRRLLLRLG